MKAFTWAAGAILAGMLLIVGLNVAGTFTSVATAPGRVVQQTMRTDNIISNYEWFHQAHANFQSRVSQIRVHKGLLASEADPVERNRIRIELVGMQSSCRDIANTYNARSLMTNRSIFMGQTASPELNPAICE